MAIGFYTVVALWSVCNAAIHDATIQLKLSNGVARSQAVQDKDHARTHATAFSNGTTVETGLRAVAGSHTIQVSIGGQQRELIIDTGSGKTAFVCVGCVHCGSKRRHPPFIFTATTRYLACDRSMTIAASGEPPCSQCENGKCQYGQTYVEGDHWTAYKATDVMQLSSSFEAPIEFGCIYEQSGVFLDQPSDGIMGFSRHPDAIHEQFYRHKRTRSRIFSQCLTETGGVLTIGGVDLARHSEPVRYTPLRNTGYQYWTVTLLAVSIGNPNNTLSVDKTEYNADRGCVLDSGTTFLYLPDSVREPFRFAWNRAVGSFAFLPQSDVFYSMTSDQVAALPDICFWFKNNAHICLPSSRYLTQIGERVYTGTVYFTPGVRATILGASVLEGHDIIYDVDNHRVGIAAATCNDPVQAQVELSLDPGGDKFHDYSNAPEWMLISVTMLAVAGLVHVIWVAVATQGEVENDLHLAKAGFPSQDEECFFVLIKDEH